MPGPSSRLNAPSPGHVIIVGGGIAGLAAAIRLAERGTRVTLLETRKKLGGRATSFDDVRSGETLDNCQHVVLGCCTAYLDLLERLGVRDQISWTREQYWIETGGRSSIVRPARLPPLPAPIHFAWSFLGARFLSPKEAVSIGRCCLAMLRVNRAAEDDHRRTFSDFLREHAQTESAIRKFWEPVVVSACNLSCDRVSSASAIHVFQEGFLAHPHAADIGLSRVPLVRLYDRALDLLAASGGTVRLGTGVESLDARQVRTTGGETLVADRVVCAVPVERVGRLLSDQDLARDPRFALLSSFEHSPIIGVHLRFDRDVLGGLPHAVLVERATQWLFRKSSDGCYIHAVISAADAMVALSEDEIAARVLSDIQACLPHARDAKLLSARAVKEKLATFAPLPGQNKLRPDPQGPSGIILAGDYTATGWPATMEGATRSGYAAAAAALDEPPQSLTPGPLPVAPLARVLGLKGE